MNQRIENTVLTAKDLIDYADCDGVVKDVAFVHCTMVEGQVTFENCRFSQCTIEGHTLIDCKCSKAMATSDSYFDESGTLKQTTINRSVVKGSETRPPYKNSGLSKVSIGNSDVTHTRIKDSNVVYCGFADCEIEANTIVHSQLDNATVLRANSAYNSSFLGGNYTQSWDSMAYECYFEQARASVGIQLYRTKLYQCNMTGDVPLDVERIKEPEATYRKSGEPDLVAMQ